MLEMLVIADDLSGAADCGVACAGYGLNTIVVMGAAPEGVAGASVLSVDADTRRLEGAKAAAETARLLEWYLRDDRPILFKKLDSMLRGNLAAELAACLEFRRVRAAAGERIVAVLAPAFPAHGRTTVMGRQLVHGKPLEQTGHWQQERAVARSYIPEVLQEAKLSAAVAGLETVRGGALQMAMKALALHADVLVCDAETEQDLRAVADASMALGRGTVWAGSAGLAYHLPAAAGLARVAATVPEGPLATGPTLFVVGSVSAASREQVQLLTTAVPELLYPGDCMSSGVFLEKTTPITEPGEAGEFWNPSSASDMIRIEIPPQVLLAGEQLPAWRECQQDLGQAVAAGREVVVLPGWEPRLDPDKGPLLTAALGEMVRPFAGQVGALLATGGETARAVLQAWGITKLRLIGEVETGVPYAVTEGWPRRLPVVTKAGSFGSPRTLLECRKFLGELDRNMTKKRGL